MPKQLKIGDIIPNITNVFLLIAGAVCLGTGCVYLIKGEVPVATTGLTGGVLLMFAATIDRFSVLKAFGLEAITRELKDKITEADDAVRELKELAEISGFTLTLLATKVGRFGGAFSFEEGYKLASQVRQNLQSLNCDSAGIAKALEPWVKVTVHDVSRRFIQDINEELQTHLQLLQQKMADIADLNDPDRTALGERMERLTAHMQTVKVHDWELPTVLARLENFISAAPELDNQTKQVYLVKLREWTPHITEIISSSNVSDTDRWSNFLRRDY